MPGGPIGGPSSGTVGTAGPIYPQKYNLPPQIQPPLTGSGAGGQGEGSYTTISVLALSPDPVLLFSYSGEEYPQQVVFLPTDEAWQPLVTTVLGIVYVPDVFSYEEAPTLAGAKGQPEEEFWFNLPFTQQVVFPQPISFGDDDQFTTRVYEEETWLWQLWSGQPPVAIQPFLQQFILNDELPVQAAVPIIEEEFWFNPTQITLQAAVQAVQQFLFNEEFPVQVVGTMVEEEFWFQQGQPVVSPVYLFYWVDSDGDLVIQRVKFVPWIADDVG